MSLKYFRKTEQIFYFARTQEQSYMRMGPDLCSINKQNVLFKKQKCSFIICVLFFCAQGENGLKVV